MFSIFSAPRAKYCPTHLITILHCSTQVEPLARHDLHGGHQFLEFHDAVIAQRCDTRRDLKLDALSDLARQHGEAGSNVAILHRLLSMHIAPKDGHLLFGEWHGLPDGNESTAPSRTLT